jgi:hypothetical protein
MFRRDRGSDTTCVLFRVVDLRRNIGILEAHRRTSAWCCPQGEGAAARCGPGFRRPNLAAPVIDITMYVRAVGSSAGPPTDASNRAAVRAALFHAPKSRLLICRLPLGLCCSRRQLVASAALAASRVAS